MHALRLLLLPALFSLTTCASAVRPQVPTFRGALGEVCTPGARATPMLMDLDTATRAELDAALGRGAVVVRYDCDRLQLVSGCYLPKAYTYVPVAVRAERLTLSGEREIKANLPFGKLSGTVGQDASLEVNYTAVGQRALPLAIADASELQGPCDGATHVISRVTLGAFTLHSTAGGRVDASAGAGPVSGALRERADVDVGRADGHLAACAAGTRSDTQPPANCDSPLQLELVPLTAGATLTAASEPGQIQAASGWYCPAGLQWRSGRCKASTSEDRCSDAQLGACRNQCAAGDGQACNSMAFAHVAGRVVARDHGEALRYAERGCALGDTQACGNVGAILLETAAGQAGPTLERALAMLDDACAHEPNACVNLGRAFAKKEKVGHPNLPLALSYFQRGCAGGDLDGCEGVTDAYWSGAGVPRDEAKARSLGQQYCQAGHGLSCRRLGAWLWQGGVTTAAVPREASALLLRGCVLGDGESCAVFALMLFEGLGDLPKEPARAENLARWACDRVALGCTSLASIYQRTGQPDRAAAAK